MKTFTSRAVTSTKPVPVFLALFLKAAVLGTSCRPTRIFLPGFQFVQLISTLIPLQIHIEARDPELELSSFVALNSPDSGMPEPIAFTPSANH